MAQNFQHPFQCIHFVKRKNGESRNVLVASAGARLFSYAAESGQRLSSWPLDGADIAIPDANGAGSNPETEGPPGKKRKVDPAEQKKNGDAPAKKTPAWTNIPILTSTPDGEYLVALTGEDKCIRVFQIEEDGSFQQLSERPMPKRPSAIKFMENNDILTGDKFGDVWSMPLIPSAEPRPAPKTPAQRSTAIAATNLTVHTARNLKSLEMQINMKSQQQEHKKASEKPVFDHDLLLGHVSLLTDVAFASLPSPDPSSTKRRNYILSADKDEHIRVSRSRPQAHIIESQCFGHTAFVSKLCIPEWAPELLISGGGDPHLIVWKWATGELLHTVPLAEQGSEADAEGQPKEIAVRGIWAATRGADSQRIIFVALEGNPTLLPFTLEPNGSMTPHKPIQTSGNILDVEVHMNTVLVSVDCIRAPGSTQEWRSATSTTLLEAFQLKQGTTEWESVSDQMLGTINATGTVPVGLTEGAEEKEKEALNGVLYGLENLRKHGWAGEETVF
ncbi:putative tRNA methyltransferase [Aspergillus mulundensis]|uniref:tRNA (Guanine-N(7)-)-methyltransferase non-catalytic subunit TRM82 n=1 Tax=Aspergillus mulundensis TaxID=1810919 RepID=A0A3D8QJ07_9EURO|nr:tRNA (guanine-N(7)-)-methyltransferase non-catalytic subunit TRM82 [Aspergillus mulundensis]RDW61802.1 tRNA (guanine-N(7)-)-methyltransferase non-catalytic subunit TRM82 [Aspergillus mulundensis]